MKRASLDAVGPGVRQSLWGQARWLGVQRRALSTVVARRLGRHGCKIAPDPLALGIIRDLFRSRETVLDVSCEPFGVTQRPTGTCDGLVRESAIEFGEVVLLALGKIAFGMNPGSVPSTKHGIDA